MGADLVIYGMKGSPFVRKVQVLLAEKGVDYGLKARPSFAARIEDESRLFPPGSYEL